MLASTIFPDTISCIFPTGDRCIILLNEQFDVIQNIRTFISRFYISYSIVGHVLV